MNYWHIRLSCPKANKGTLPTPWFTELLDKCVYNPVVHTQTFSNINQRLDRANIGDLVVLHIGGDQSNKRHYEKPNRS